MDPFTAFGLVVICAWVALIAYVILTTKMGDW